MTLPTLLILTASVCLNALAQIFLRMAMAGRSLSAGALFDLVIKVLSQPPFWAGMSCYGLSIGLWLIVLSRLPVGVAYPLLSIGYIVATALGIAFLGESVNYQRMLGVGLICARVFFISRTA